MSSCLPGLVILAAEDHHVKVAVRLDAKELVRDRRVPPQRVGHDALGHTSGDHVAGVERQLGLKERGAGHVRRSPTSGLCVAITTSSQRTVWPADLHRARLVAEFVGVRVLVDVARPAPRTPSRRPRDSGADGCAPDSRTGCPGDRPVARRRGIPRRIPARARASRRPADVRPPVRVSSSSGACRYPSTHSKPASMPCSRTTSSIVAIAASPASQTACAWLRPKRLTSSVMRASVTIVRCALVCPVSVIGAAIALEHDDRVCRPWPAGRRR